MLKVLDNTTGSASSTCASTLEEESRVLNTIGSPVAPEKSGYPFSYCLVVIREPRKKKGKRVLLGNLEYHVPPPQPLRILDQIIQA